MLCTLLQMILSYASPCPCVYDGLFTYFSIIYSIVLYLSSVYISPSYSFHKSIYTYHTYVIMSIFYFFCICFHTLKSYTTDRHGLIFRKKYNWKRNEGKPPPTKMLVALELPTQGLAIFLHLPVISLVSKASLKVPWEMLELELDLLPSPLDCWRGQAVCRGPEEGPMLQPGQVLPASAGLRASVFPLLQG